MILKGVSESQLPRRILVIQVLLTLVLAAGGLLVSTNLALSLLIGGGTCSLASALFAASVFGPYRAARPEALVGRIIAAEIGKLILVIGLLVFAFSKVQDLLMPAMLAAYFAAQVVPVMVAPYWGADSKR